MDIFFDKINIDNIMLIKSNRSQIKDIKNFCSKEAERFLISGYDNISSINKSMIERIYNKINQITIHKKNRQQRVRIVDFFIDSLWKLYSNLAFSIDNKWLNLICNNKNINITKQDILMIPRKLTKTELLGLILTLNPGIDINSACQILNDIYKN